jgi:Recombinase
MARALAATITARLNGDLVGYPSPGGKGWTDAAVKAILANPKYTGHQVYGRRTRLPSPPTSRRPIAGQTPPGGRLVPRATRPRSGSFP